MVPGCGGSAGTTPRGARHGSLGDGGAAGAPAMRGCGARLHETPAQSKMESRSGTKRSGRDTGLPAGPRRAIEHEASDVCTKR
jgi:hypothetical protein